MQVELHQITKRFGRVTANNRITLSISSGRVTGLLGENGAGKSTLMRILAGLLPAGEGEIRIDGNVVPLANPRQALAAGIGMLHQDPVDCPSMTVLDNFLLDSGTGIILNRKKEEARLLALAGRLGFDLPPQARMGSLPVGLRQQAELLRLLARGAKLLILDEPAAGAGGRQREVFFPALQKLAGQGMSLILVTHRLAEVEQLCDQVAVLRQGSLAGRFDQPFDQQTLIRAMFGEDLPLPARITFTPRSGLLEFRNAVWQGERWHVSCPEFQLAAGEAVGLAGLEGSGQDVFLRGGAGLLRMLQGHACIKGVCGSSYSAAGFVRAGGFFLPAARAEEGFIPGLPVADHFKLVRQGWKAAGKADFRKLVQDRLTAFGLACFPENRWEDLSGGNLQRLMFALLPEDARILLLEHPSRGLDLRSARLIWDNLRLRLARGAGIIFASSDPDELLTCSRRILVFSRGCMTGPYDTETLTKTGLGRLIGGLPAAGPASTGTEIGLQS